LQRVSEAYMCNQLTIEKIHGDRITASTLPVLLAKPNFQAHRTHS
jgi:hypothetical protein